ncbi:MAG: protoporphyrinogen oxidase [Acidimicrobiales bacterium]
MTQQTPTPDLVIAVVGGGMAGLAAAWQLADDLGASGSGSSSRARIVVLEASSRVGGKVRSTEFCGRTVDVAADAFLARRPEATGLCSELGLDDALVSPGASGAALWSRGRLRMMPDGVNLGVPTKWWPLFRSGILSPGGSARAGVDLFRPHRATPGAPIDRAVGTVVAARLGRQVVERLVDPLVGGIHAGGVDELSAESTFPPLLAADRLSGSLMRRLGQPPSPAQSPPKPAAAPGTRPTPVFWSLEGTAARLPAELAVSLMARGVVIHTGVAVESMARTASDGSGLGRWRLILGGDAAVLAGISHTSGPVEATASVDTTASINKTASADTTAILHVDGVILAVPAGQAAGLLTDHAPMAATLLADIRHASVAVVTLSMPTGAIRRDLVGTGFLVPRTATIAGRAALITGCTYLTQKWPGLARPDDELIRLSIGRHGDVRQDELNDDELTAAAFGELAGILDIVGQPRHSMVTRWDGAFPQYAVGHLSRTTRIEQSVAELPGVAVAGAAYRGVGIPAVIGSGRASARAVLRSLDGPVTGRPGR